MRICLSHLSALEYYRSLLDDYAPRFKFARPNAIESCGFRVDDRLGRKLSECGVQTRPLHLLCSRSHRQNSRAGTMCHSVSSGLPRSSLIVADDEVLVCAPSLTIVQVASCLREIDAALVAFELCGTYSLSSDGFKGRRDALCSRAKLERYLASSGEMRGTKKARAIAGYLLDASASPMETAMAMLISAPTRLGGMGIDGALLNKEVTTPGGVRRVDMVWPEYRLGLEYQSESEHRGWVKRELDDRRRNDIVAKGVEIMSVYYRDLSMPGLFDELIRNIASVMGRRVRIRVRDFKYRQSVLRSRVLPPVRWGC